MAIKTTVTWLPPLPLTRLSPTGTTAGPVDCRGDRLWYPARCQRRAWAWHRGAKSQQLAAANTQHGTRCWQPLLGTHVRRFAARLRRRSGPTWTSTRLSPDLYQRPEPALGGCEAHADQMEFRQGPSHGRATPACCADSSASNAASCEWPGCPSSDVGRHAMKRSRGHGGGRSPIPTTSSALCRHHHDWVAREPELSRCATIVTGMCSIWGWDCKILNRPCILGVTTLAQSTAGPTPGPATWTARLHSIPRRRLPRLAGDPRPPASPAPGGPPLTGRRPWHRSTQRVAVPPKYAPAPAGRLTAHAMRHRPVRVNPDHLPYGRHRDEFYGRLSTALTSRLAPQVVRRTGSVKHGTGIRAGRSVSECAVRLGISCSGSGKRWSCLDLPDTVGRLAWSVIYDGMCPIGASKHPTHLQPAELDRRRDRCCHRRGCPVHQRRHMWPV